MYAWETRGAQDHRLPDVLREFTGERRISAESREYLETLIGTVDMYLEDIDRALADALLNWRLDRLATIDRCILRLAGAEMLYLEIPPRVAIREAVQLAGKYGTHDSPRFVNGVLDAIMRRAADERSTSGERR
jgi:N utilization substance protein B